MTPDDASEASAADGTATGASTADGTATGASAAYDEIAAGYAASNPSEPARADYEWPAVRGLLPDLDGSAVLDAACGSGHYAAWMAERGADVIGVDASEAMVEQARADHGDAATFEHADLREDLPFADGRFDLVVSQLTLEHVRDWHPVMAEFARVLGEDGQLVVSTDHPFSTYFVIEHEPPEIGSADAQSADYYAVERYERDWGDVSMPCYRRSLSAVLAPLFEAGFALTDLREPLPQVDVENLNYFAEETPRFLAVRARIGNA